MRLVTWNCRVGGFRLKARFVAELRPDVLAVQEVEPLERVKAFAGDLQPTFRDRVTDPDSPRRAIGTFSYTGLRMKAVDADDPMFHFRRFEARQGNRIFHVASVWTYDTGRVKTAYRQSHDGLVRHAEWIRRRPTVLLGDFNANACFPSKNWAELLALLDDLGLASAYHRFFGEEPGRESRPTHFHLGREDRPFHLDYCFLPEAWIPRIRDVRVGTYADWRPHSDHAPLIVDLDA